MDPASPTADFTQLTQSFAAEASQRVLFNSVGFYGQDEWHVRPNLTLMLALRGEHYSNPACQNRCFARLAGPFASVSHDPAQPYNQAILTNQKQALAGTDALLWSPRFSFAWQPFGFSRNTVIRGGVGIFYDPVPGNVAHLLSSNPPLLNSYTLRGDNLTPGEKTNLFNDAAASNTAFVNGFYAGQTLAQIQAQISSFYPPGFTPPFLTDPQRTTHAPQYQRWSLEWQQAFGSDTSLKVMYTGHHGIHEFLLDPNANAYGFGSLPATVCSSPPMPPCADPRFAGVTNIASVAVSNYNGMVVSFLQRFSRWGSGMFQANYTYGHALDEVSNGGQITFTTIGLLSPQDPNNLRGAYGSAEYDVRHSFNAGYVWELPLKAALRGHGSDSLVNGWQAAGTIFAHTGFPYTAFDIAKSYSLAGNNYFGTLYAVPVGAVPSGIPCGKAAASPNDPQTCLPPQLLPNGNPNPGALFVQSGCETGFNEGDLGPSGVCNGAAVALVQGRNRFRGPGYINTDLTIMKNTNLPRWESAQLGVGFEFYNLFNHPNFGIPNGDMSNPSFGQILYTAQSDTGILGSGRGGDASARMIRLKLQLRF